MEIVTFIADERIREIEGKLIAKFIREKYGVCNICDLPLLYKDLIFHKFAHKKCLERREDGE